MAYRFALSLPPACVSTFAVSFGLDATVSAMRPPTLVEDRLEAYSTRILPTDLCHPTYLSNLHPRSWLSSCLSLAGGEPRLAQRIEGHDVSRRRCPLPPDPTIGARVFAEAVRTDRASDTPVARSCRRAALSDDCAFTFEPRPPSPRLREET
jgi:hypothetical protein